MESLSPETWKELEELAKKIYALAPMVGQTALFLKVDWSGPTHFETYPAPEKIWNDGVDFHGK